MKIEYPNSKFILIMMKMEMKEKPIRVLQFPVRNTKGGITQYVLRNWKYVDRTRFQFDFATMSKTLDFAGDLEKEGCRIHYISSYAEDNRDEFDEQFREILEQGNYDIVHLHTKQWKSFEVERIAKEVGVKKVIIHAHNTGVDVTAETKNLSADEKQHYRMRDLLKDDLATEYWACSKKAADFIYGDKIDANKICIMNNAIELEKYRFSGEKRGRLRRDLRYRDDEFVLGIVGRLEYQKNQSFMIETLKALINDDIKCRLLLIGEGEKRKEYMEMAKSLGIEDRITFLGFCSNVEDYLSSIDRFCTPSQFEGLLFSIIEAQANGLTCFASKEITEEADVSGNVKFLPLKKEVWVDQIKECLHTGFKRDLNSIGKMDGFDIKKQIKRIEKEYLKVRI